MLDKPFDLTDHLILVCSYRRGIEHEMNMRFVQTAFKGTPGAAAAMARVRALMEERLAAKPELRDVLIPEWNVGCRRREEQSAISQ
jgi:hypothetical protein